MSTLTEKRCKPCEGGTAPLNAAEAAAQLARLAAGWELAADRKSIWREYRCVDFYRTMSLVNAIAHIANQDDHHPDLEVGYNYCRVRYSTHSIGGLSENDFICAAKIDLVAAL